MTSSSSTSQITRPLMAWSNGDQCALAALTPLVHEELRRLAHHYMKRERQGPTLQTSALVNEAYLKLINQKHVAFKTRSQFLALSATLMRHILVDHARNRRYVKRGVTAQRVSCDEGLVVSSEKGTDVIALDEALDRLTAIDPRTLSCVSLVVSVLKGPQRRCTPQSVTVMREWSMAKAWLYNTVSNET